jgi:hypothetical protein
MVEKHPRTIDVFNPNHHHALPPFLDFLCIDAGSLDIVPSVRALRTLKIVAQPNDTDELGMVFLSVHASFLSLF